MGDSSDGMGPINSQNDGVDPVKALTVDWDAGRASSIPLPVHSYTHATLAHQMGI
jgi:hypothetical protein